MLGFIGCGNMGSAIIKGIIDSGIDPKNMYAYDHHKEKILNTNSKINICSNNIEVVNKSKYIFLAIKPHLYNEILQAIKDHLTYDKIIIIMAAGYTIKQAEEIIGNKKIVRIMPNTPALIKQGFITISYNNKLSIEEKNIIINLLKNIGTVKEINEDLMNAYSSITGSGPAFVYLFIEAMADAALLLGIPKKEAYEAISTMIIGSAKLLLETSKHPAELRDMVTSPSGTTIEGIRTLEEKAFRSSIIECVVNTYKKNLDIKNIR